MFLYGSVICVNIEYFQVYRRIAPKEKPGAKGT